MRRSQKPKANGAGSISEMAIVNAFTRLIFADDSYTYTAQELSIIEAFRAMDHAVARHSYNELGEYLRSLGVREMIQLVSSLRQYLADDAAASPANRATPAHAPKIDSPARGRNQT